MTVLATIPSPTQGVWHLGPLPIRAYALCIIAGIVLAVLDRRAALGRPRRRARATCSTSRSGRCRSASSAAGSTTSSPPRSPTSAPTATRCEAFAIWEGGLGIWGAIALGGVGAWIACRRRGIPLPAFADALAPGLLVAQAVGRLGNWFNNELLRRADDAAVGAEDLPVGRRPRRRRPRRAARRRRHLPPDVPVRAALEPGGGRAWWSGPTAASGSATAARSRSTWPPTALGRLWIELLRDDSAEHFFGIRLNVFTAIIVGLLAVAYLVVAARPATRGHRPAGRGGRRRGPGRARRRAPSEPTDATATVPVRRARPSRSRGRPDTDVDQPAAADATSVSQGPAGVPRRVTAVYPARRTRR